MERPTDAAGVILAAPLPLAATILQQSAAATAVFPWPAPVESRDGLRQCNKPPSNARKMNTASTMPTVRAVNPKM